MSSSRQETLVSIPQASETTTRSLEALPDEVLLMVFENVEGLQNRRSVSLSCRRFCNINVPVLHRDIVYENKPPPISKLLRYFLRHKEFCAYAKSFTFSTNINESLVDKEILEKLCEENFGRTIDKAMPFDEDEGAYFLIGMLPNLESFSTICYHHKTPWLDVAVTPAWEDVAPTFAPDGNAFGNLTKLSISHWDTENGISYNTVIRCLAIPTLVDFIVDKVTSDEIHYKISPAAKLRVLTLKDANLDSKCLKDILSYGKGSLESFTFSHGGAIIGYDDLNLSALSDAIYDCGKTLHSCDLEFGEGCNEEEVYGVISRLPPLLCRLRCPVSWLSTRIHDAISHNPRLWQGHTNHPAIPISSFLTSPISILPESLEALELIDCESISQDHSYKVIQNYLAQLSEAKLDSTLPNLRSISLAGMYIEWCPKELENSDLRPEIRFGAGGNYLMGGMAKYFNGQPCPVGTRPDDPTWVTREGWRLKALYESVSRAGIKISAVVPEYLVNPSYIVPVITDSDPFRLAD